MKYVKGLCLKCKKRTKCKFLKEPGNSKFAEGFVKCIEFEEK